MGLTFLRRYAPRVLCFGALCIALVAVPLVAEAPREPARLAGLLRVDALAVLFAVLLALTALFCKGPRVATLLGLGLLFASLAMTHLLAIAGLYLLATLCLERGRARLVMGVLACGLLGGGLALIALGAGVWRYQLPGAGLGLHSLSTVLLLGAVISGAGHWRMPFRRALPAPHPLLVLAWSYPLLRLFSLGPWNIGWSLAALLVGATAALWAAWRANGADDVVSELVGQYAALALVGTGLASGAGVALAAVALLCVPLLVLGGAEQGAGVQRWLLTPAVPFSLPFVAIWLGAAAAFGGGSSILAMALWAAGLGGVLALRRPTPGAARPVWALNGAAGLSLALGTLAPAWLMWLVQPVIAQLQGGLSPYGDVGFWPWAGMFALDAARQPVATLPSVALAVLMLVLGALVWLGLRLRETILDPDE